MSDQTAVIAFAVFNLVLLLLAFIAWRLLRTPKATGEKNQRVGTARSADAKGTAPSAEAPPLDGGDAMPSGGDAVPSGLGLADADVSDPARQAAGADPEVATTDRTTGATTPEPTALHPVLDQVPSRPNSRRFVPGGVPVRDGSVPDFTLAMAHLFTADNGVLNRKREASAEPITLSIQAGPRPVTPLLERVVEALTNIGLEPAQTRPLVHSFSDSAGRCARVRLAHSPAHGDLIEIEIEPSLSPSAMASVMALLSDLDFEPADVMTSTPSRQF